MQRRGRKGARKGLLELGVGEYYCKVTDVTKDSTVRGEGIIIVLK